MTTISLDGVSSSSIPELVIERVSRQITPGVRDSYRDVPGRPGSWLFPEAAGDRTISITFAAVGSTFDARRTAVRAAAAWLYGAGTGLRKLIISDEPDRFVWAKLADVVESDELLARGRFTATFRVSPFSYSTTISSAILSGSGTVSITPEVGFADTFEPSIEVTAGALLATGFSIALGGRTIVYGSSLASSGKVTVSTISSTVATGADPDTDLVGLFTGSALAMTAVSGDFPILRPGSNVVTFTGGTATLSIRWRRRYV